MLITPERKVPQWSDASQNDHKSKGFLPVKNRVSDFCIVNAAADVLDG